MRTIIDIPDTQIDLLSNLVEQEKISRAVLIRRAISEYLARYQVKQTDAIIQASAEVENALLITRNTKDFSEDDPAIRVPYTL